MRRITAALLACGAVLALGASSAAAQTGPSYECAGTGGVIDGRSIRGDLVIPTGAVCTVKNSRISGDVIMETGTRSVELTKTRVGGSVTGKSTTSFGLDGSFVRSDVAVDGSFIGGRVCNSEIAGDAAFSQFRLLLLIGDTDRPAADGSDECLRNKVYGSLTLERNSAQLVTETNMVYGDVIARANTGTIGFERNLIFGRLDCQDNTGTIEGRDNVAYDGEHGQCANL